VHKDIPIEIKHLEQWFFRITKYADELYEKIDELKDWPFDIRAMQKNWIGKSKGVEIDFEIPYENQKIIQINDVEHFRKEISINSKLKIKGKEHCIKEIVKFKFDDGNYYMKLFLDDGYVLADDLGGNSFILVKEVKTSLSTEQKKINFKDKNLDFFYNAHATAEKTYGEQVFPEGDSESFWNYSSKDGAYLSLGIIDKTKRRLDFFGDIVYSKDIQILKKSEKWAIFTTRPDTIYGVTFMVVSAQHPRLMELVTNEQKKEIGDFLRKLKSTSEKDASEFEKEGVFTGSYAINPVNGERVPVYAGNFVVADYGSGMVMAVPSHDQRDFDFAKKYKISMKEVIRAEKDAEEKGRAYTGEGILVNSEDFNGISSRDAIEKISRYIEKEKIGKQVVNYKLRDWLLSRQRFWGAPIPVIYCDKCGIVPVPEKELPVKLPEKVVFGEGNPLAMNKEFVETKCPKCKGKARRETDTMDTFVNSSWYFLRYCDAKNSRKIFDRKKAAYWMPIDLYIGGKEHACMHLIYFRYYTKFLRDIGLLGIDEPAVKLFNQGMIHGPDGAVMSKSRGNVVDPLEVINKYSADALRLFLVSIASPEKDSIWSVNGFEGSWKFVNRVYEAFGKIRFGKPSARFEHRMNKAIRKISENIENMKYNLAVIELRELSDAIEQEDVSKSDYGNFIKMLSVFCPHLGEELWEKMGNKGFVSISEWPDCDESKINEKFDEADKAADKAAEDILNVLRIIREKEGKDAEKVYLYTLPSETANYNPDVLSKRVGKEIIVFAVNDKKKYDPSEKAGKAKPGKPGIYVE